MSLGEVEASELVDAQAGGAGVTFSAGGLFATGAESFQNDSPDSERPADVTHLAGNLWGTEVP